MTVKKGGLMEDMISRKAAIDLFPDDDLECDTKGGYIAPHLARQMICELPSAQPETHEERTKTHSCDLIDRQAAIDAVENIDCSDGVGISALKCEAVDDGVTAIKALPSAHPKIIRCRDCRHFEYDHPYIIQGVPVLGHEVCNAWGDGCKTDENGYCFLAERRTDDRNL